MGALVLPLLAGWYAWTLFLTSGDLRYVLVRSWGSGGTAPGELSAPIGVAIGPAGDVYVTDSGNNRIQRFRPDGTLVAMWGGVGEELGDLDRPMHAGFGPDGYLYVAEYINDRIQIFGVNGEAIRVLGTSGSEPGAFFDAPGGVAVALNRELIVVDFYNHRAQRLGPTGGVLGALGTSGRILSGALHYPTDVAILSGGDIVVADAYNNRIQIFGPDGSFQRKWGGPLGLGIPGSWPGWFRVATGVAVGPADRVYVADFDNNRIQVFTADGALLGVFGDAGDVPARLERPTDVRLPRTGQFTSSTSATTE